MISRIVIALALGLGYASAGLDRSIEARFYDHIKEYNLELSGAEFVERLAIFAANDKMIQIHNAGNFTYKLGHNQFSHLTNEEFIEYNNLRPYKIPAKGENMHTAERPNAATSVDWVEAGAVTGVKDQGSCGSCWSFSTTGALEGAYYIENNDLQSFSEQQLVSCDTNDYGCNGGLMDNAFRWIQSNGGICSEDDYPYVSGGGREPTCETTCTEVSGTAITSWTDVEESEDALASAVAQQPVSVAIEADQTSFQFYTSGVLTGSCGTNLDHGVLAVGYGTDSGTKYWKVKNSWGASWGEDGYIRIEKGNSQTGGQCGILMSASYPTL